MIRRIIRICNNNYIIRICFCTHCVISDDYLPVSAPVIPGYQNRLVIFQLRLNLIQSHKLINLIARIIISALRFSAGNGFQNIYNIF